jgi:hypothetical protein
MFRFSVFVLFFPLPYANNENDSHVYKLTKPPSITLIGDLRSSHGFMFYTRTYIAFLRGIFGFFLFMNIILHCLFGRLSDFTVSEDAGIEPRTVATLALTARRSNHLARSHPQG